jgi:hypothetical protein
MNEASEGGQYPHPCLSEECNGEESERNRAALEEDLRYGPHDTLGRLRSGRLVAFDIVLPKLPRWELEPKCAVIEKLLQNKISIAEN